MFLPKYTPTPKILSNLAQIERLYGRIETTRIPQNLFLNLERDNLIQSSFASNSIEGNPLSQAQVSNLLLNDRVPVNRDEKEVVNYFKILRGLESRIEINLDLSVVLDIHKELMTGINQTAGQIRDREIVVGSRGMDQKIFVKHNPPFHNRPQIELAINELAGWLENEGSPILKAGIFHHQFVYIHPFEDGNGRTCRLLTALIFLKHNYLINKYFVLDDYYDIDRLAYSDALHSADAGDKTAWLEYFTDGVKFSLQSALGRIEAGISKLDFETRPTKRETEVLEIIQKNKEVSSENIVNQLNVSRQQASKLLKSLTEKGFLEKKGTTKGSFYLLR